MSKQALGVTATLGTLVTLGTKQVFESNSPVTLHTSLSVMNEKDVGNEIHGAPATLLSADSFISDSNAIPDNLTTFNLSAVGTAPVASPAPAKSVPAKPVAVKPAAKAAAVKVVPKPKKPAWQNPERNITFSYTRREYYNKTTYWILSKGDLSAWYISNTNETKAIEDSLPWFWFLPGKGNVTLKCKLEKENSRDYICQHDKTKKRAKFKFAD